MATMCKTQIAPYFMLGEKKHLLESLVYTVFLTTDPSFLMVPLPADQIPGYRVRNANVPNSSLYPNIANLTKLNLTHC